MKLALKIFTDTNAAALNCYGPNHENLENWEGTATFIMLIWKWWSAVNVKHPFKGRNTLNKYARPVDCSDHETLQFLSDFATWLDRWSLKSHAMNEGFLTKDTYLTFKHTLKAIVEVSKFVLSDLKLDFVLLGKFQTDDLESRFGQYRQMCGGNRLVSVQEIMESEKRLKIKSLLKLHSSSIAISVKEYLFEFCGSPDNTKISEEDQLIATFPYNQVQFDETQLPVLLHMAGYAAKKTSAKINCISCKQLLVDESCEKLEVDIDKSIIAYFEELNRGGLTYPSSTLLHAFQASPAIFNICISEDFEKVFLKLSNPKYFLCRLIYIIGRTLICFRLSLHAICASNRIQQFLCNVLVYWPILC